jgi:hypothetical protein
MTMNILKLLKKKLGFENNKIFPETLPISKIGSGSSFNNINKEKINYRYKILIENHKKEWEKIKSFDEINIYMKKIFNISI